MTKKKEDPFAGLKDSAHKIWLAGLGALSEAEEQGDRLFKSLVKKGRKYDASLRESLESAGERVFGSMEAAGGEAGKAFRDIESTFDAQVAAAMDRLGVARKAEVDALRKEVSKLRREAGTKPASGKKAATKKASRSPARSAAKRKTKRT